MSSDGFNFMSFHSWPLQSIDDVKTKKEGQLPQVDFHVIKYTDKCLYLWIGDSSASMDNLACAMETPLERDPIGIEIMQAVNVEQQGVYAGLGKDLASKLSKRLKKQVFVSFNVNQNLLEQTPMLSEDSLESSDANLLLLIERSLFAEIKSKPECF